MKLRTKITIDKIFGNLFIFVFGIVIKFFRLFIKSNFKKVKHVKRIAVCKLLGMGSIIQSTCLVKSLKTTFPEAELIFITSIKNKNLLKIIKPIDKIYVIDDRSIISLLISVIKFKTTFLFKRIDYYIDLEVHSNFSTILTFLSFATNKIGYYLKEEWFRVCLYTEMIYYNINAPVVKVYNQSAELLGAENVETALYNFNTIASKEDTLLIEKLKSINQNFSNKYIIVNPNASDLRIERRWNYRNYVELINSILGENQTYKIVLTGNKSEVKYVNKIYSEIDKKYKLQVIDTSGKLSIEELISLIRNCNLMISNDSGPMHIAFALNKITIALFGPCSPQQYTTQKNVRFIYKNIYCSPCVHQFTISPCKGDNQCMKQLNVNDVYNIIREILNTNQIKISNIQSDIVYKNADDLPLGLLKNI